MFLNAFSSSVSNTTTGGASSSSWDSSSQNVSHDSMWEQMFEEEEEREGENWKDNAERDAIVFLVDCSADMLTARTGEDGEQEESPFTASMRAIISAVQEKIVAAENDLLALCLYGTEEKRNANEFAGVYVLHQLDTPTVAMITDAEELLERSKQGVCVYGQHQGEFEFCDALWTCSTIFSNCGVKMGSKRVFIFTCEDNPNGEDIALKEQALQRARDLSELGIEIELFALNPPGGRFVPTHFYSEVLDIPDGTDGAEWSPASKFEELQQRVLKKEFRKRSLATLPFQIVPGMEMDVRLYTTFREAPAAKSVWLDKETNNPVKVVTKWMCKDTTKMLRKEQIKHYFPYGGAKVVFDKAEVDKIKVMYPPGITLLGFKNEDRLKDYHNVTHASFIYPDETSVKGSITAFSSLLDAMARTGKIAICRFVPRSNSQPMLVALVPQVEIWDEETQDQIRPSGFNVIPLPWGDDLRDLLIPKQEKADAPQVAAAKKLIRTLQIQFSPHDFPNPALQQHYAALQAMALNKEEVEKVEDALLPDEEGIERFKGILHGFRDAVFPADYVPSTTKTKRSAATPYSGDWHALVEHDSNQRKVTVVQIKMKLEELGQRPSGKRKADFWAQLKTALEGQPPQKRSKVKAEVKAESIESEARSRPASSKQRREARDGGSRQQQRSRNRNTKVKREPESSLQLFDDESE